MCWSTGIIDIELQLTTTERLSGIILDLSNEMFPAAMYAHRLEPESRVINLCYNCLFLSVLLDPSFWIFKIWQWNQRSWNFHHKQFLEKYTQRDYSYCFCFELEYIDEINFKLLYLDEKKIPWRDRPIPVKLWQCHSFQTWNEF